MGAWGLFSIQFKSGSAGCGLTIFLLSCGCRQRLVASGQWDMRGLCSVRFLLGCCRSRGSVALWFLENRVSGKAVHAAALDPGVKA